MKCPKCGCTSSVVDSRIIEPFGYVRRRRACEKCSNRWNTQECVDDNLEAHQHAEKSISEAIDKIEIVLRDLRVKLRQL